MLLGESMLDVAPNERVAGRPSSNSGRPELVDVAIPSAHGNVHARRSEYETAEQVGPFEPSSLVPVRAPHHVQPRRIRHVRTAHRIFAVDLCCASSACLLSGDRQQLSVRINVVPGSFIVSAKDSNNEPVMMAIGPLSDHVQ
ncbi:hypothetical protein HL666_20450 [Bradyrhizobium sp. 83002]|uniref:hypothetical protein n=1 Tax=Bradyrhizobium aeschynomenes TaxID=2734909 RepID=UPI001556911C|nr:hypothetical protein [Bradyrhizobium aeschynomenes]NPU13143.1 hypothetical protein [Bradyrhizobium aeschynomenes]